jgi:ornithine carbamoyltransferase
MTMAITPTPLKHYLQFSDLNASEYAYLFERAALIKKKFKAYERHQPLIDRTMVMIFEKASTRTRVSFEAGMYQLGGTVVNLTTEGSQLGRAEPIEDSAKVISRMVDLVMIRTFEQTKINRFAEHSRVPVINGLTNEFHPCQILADIFTYIEHRGSIKGKTVAATRWTSPSQGFAQSIATRCSKTPCRPALAPTWSPRTCGPAWATKRRTKRAKRPLPTGV